MALAMTNKIYSKQSFLILIAVSSFTFVFSIDTLTSSEFLGFNKTLISSAQKFEAGFFIPPGSDPPKIYLGIWYYNLPGPKTIVWVANRDNPASNASVSLNLKSDGGGQIAVTWNGTELWTSNKSTSDVVSPFVRLLDSGNLVVQEDKSDGNYIWQSFDYPGDTLLPSQKLGWTRKTGFERLLLAWKGLSDPSSGNYTLNITRTGDPELSLQSGTKIIYRTGPFMGQSYSGIPAMTAIKGINFTLSYTKDEVYYIFILTDLSIRSRMVVGSDGILYRYTWVPQDQHWSTFWYHPAVLCDHYLACGSYGVCDDGHLFDCTCLQGFAPEDSSALSLRDGSNGCVRKTALECAKDGFKVMGNMKLPMSETAKVDMAKELKECERDCKNDCNCTAYSNARVVDGVGSGCIMWTGDLLDMRKFQQGGQDLYVRLAAAELRTNKAMIIEIGAGVSVATLIVVAIAAYFVWRAKNKPSDQAGSTTRDLQLPETTAPNKDLFLYNKNEDDFELPMYNFEAIVEITNNFSDDNKLGQGGFGAVYKGVLNGVQEIAIKRLSEFSIQGFKEFKNEVQVIAKLRHKNLVRLLGYCVEKEEKILIYEYLHNRSLDFILFDQERCSILNWQKRFNIICGVARGLMYLHHDSIEMIIHRDLKASNILLDDDMNPKISDFGMARIFLGDETETNFTVKVVGTHGYISPEYAMGGVFSIKSDVFSFGVLMLEIVTGRQTKPFHRSRLHLNLLGYAWKMWKEGRGEEALDPSISHSYRLHEVLKCIQVGLLCVQEDPDLRPTMVSVIQMLSSEAMYVPQPTLPGYYLESNEPMSETSSNPSQSISQSVISNQISVTMINGR